MSIRIPGPLRAKLTEIAGLLTIQRKKPVGMREALEWVFEQLPPDYLEKLKEQVLYPPEVSS